MRSLGDLSGRTYHFWEVIEPAAKSKTGKKKWLCKCVCGVERQVYQNVLVSGKSKSCGCRNGEDLTGLRFGKLCALQPVTRADGVRLWRCLCDCGQEALIRANSLKNGSSTSCGCNVRAKGKIIKKPNADKDPTKKFYSLYKHRAKKQVTEFSLTFPDFKSLVSGNCFYCGTPPKEVEPGVYLNGIGTIDPKLGYTARNVIACCKKCDRARNGMKVGEFILWAEGLAEYQKNKNGQRK